MATRAAYLALLFAIICATATADIWNDDAYDDPFYYDDFWDDGELDSFEDYDSDESWERDYEEKWRELYEDNDDEFEKNLIDDEEFLPADDEYLPVIDDKYWNDKDWEAGNDNDWDDMSSEEDWDDDDYDDDDWDLPADEDFWPEFNEVSEEELENQMDIDMQLAWEEADRQWEADFWQDDLEESIEELLDDNNYWGAAVGVMKDGKLVFAQGYGDIGERAVHPSTLLPISSISKMLTAVSILKLAEEGFISLEDQVFGADGLLSAFTPINGIPQDPRINDITVDNLLRHAGGWDEEEGPVYDPMMNQFYLQRGEDVVNIATAMNVRGMLNQYDIVRFMISAPLQFTPGTKYRYSNFGYCVLGRIIEQVTGMPYEEYVRKNILVPAGMMHTRVGPNPDDEEIVYQGAGDSGESDTNSQMIHRIISPQLLDSTSGWYSNIYDLARFTKCLFGGETFCALLRPESVRYMTERPPIQSLYHEDTWRAIAVHVTDAGVIWQDSDINDNDVIFYHQGPPQKSLFDMSSPYSDDGNITFIALTTSNRYKRLKSAMEKLVSSVRDWPDMPDTSLEQLSKTYLREADQTEVLIKFALSEHHLEAYISALRIAGFYPFWIQGHTWFGISDFIILSRKAEHPEELDFKFFLGNNKKKLYNRVSEYEDQGYYVDLVQSYKSFSHDGLTSHIVYLRRPTYTITDQEWAVDAPLDEYFEDLNRLTALGYAATVQSVEKHGHKEYVSYIITQAAQPEGDYLSYHSISLDQLEFLVKSQAMDEYHLEYLDTYRDEKFPMFSAVFRKGATQKWLLQTDMNEDEVSEQSVVWHNMGYIPKLLVAYERHDHGLKYVGLWILP